MEWDVIIGCTFDVFVTRTQVELLMDPKTNDILHTHEKCDYWPEAIFSVIVAIVTGLLFNDKTCTLMPRYK